MTLRHLIGWFRGAPDEAASVVARRDTFVTTAVLLALLFALLGPYRHGHVGTIADKALVTSDFGAFYCWALVAREGHDPYLLAPLRACEVERVYAPGGSTYAQHGIDPAPLPPYDLALFLPFTFLSYRDAGLLWTALLVVALLAAAVGLQRLTRYPLWAMLAVLAITGGTVPFAYGQIQPLITVALVAAALLLQSGRARWAAVAASVTLIEPHVGLAPMLALFLCARARFVVGLAGMAAVALALVIAGPAILHEYFAQVLPAHAFSEITVQFQYSLTALLYALRVPASLALRIATLQYAATVAVGVLAAPLLARRLGKPALVLFPAASVVLGGAFIHITQLTCALPFAVYCAASAPRFAAWCWAAIALVALPWYVASQSWIPLEIAIVASAATFGLPNRPIRVRLGVAVALVGLCAASMWALRRVPERPLRAPDPPSVVAAAGYDPALASTQWAVEARTDPAYYGATLRRLAVRIPTWAGLALVFITGLVAARSLEVDLKTSRAPVRSKERARPSRATKADQTFQGCRRHEFGEHSGRCDRNRRWPRRLPRRNPAWAAR